MEQLFHLHDQGENISRTNLLYGCDGQISDTIPPPEAYTVATVIFLTIIVSVFGNSLIIVAVYRIKLLQTPTNALLCSLAITDLLGPIVRLLSLGIAMVLGKWTFGCNWCVVSSTLGILFGAGSINHLCLISVERCITINFPYKAKQFIHKRSITVAIFIVWTVSIVCSLLPFVGVGLVRFTPTMLDCEVYLGNEPKLGLVLGGVYFIFPFTVMVIVYTLIFCISVRKQTKQMFTYSIGRREEKQKQKMKAEMKALKTVMIVVGFFFLLWLPYFITSGLEPFHPSMVPSWWKRFSFILAYMNSCCNWIVYGVRNKQMRNAFKSVLGISNKRRTSETSEKSIASQTKSTRRHVFKCQDFNENNSNS
ncbi:beta-2 adrenergic receptor-like [Clytia hemisphaerica]|uniref:beta-2 adrenergic receptor-like n=1 Tax=Clytia hemisphaerica TaxID=252671 RepID=UPI0034D5E73B